MASKREDDKSVFMHKFHGETLQKGVDLLTQDVSKYEAGLVTDYENYLTDKLDPKVQEFYKDYFKD